MVLTWIPDHSSSNRVKHDIPAELQKVGVSLDQNGLEPALKNMAHSIVSTIETLGVDTVQMSHPRGEISVNRFHNKVIVIVHKTVSVTMPVEAFHRLLENEEKPGPITVALKNLHPGVSPRGQMVNRAWKFNPHGSCHNAHHTPLDLIIQDLTPYTLRQPFPQ
jgi:hypothetical protein